MFRSIRRPCGFCSETSSTASTPEVVVVSWTCFASGLNARLSPSSTCFSSSTAIRRIVPLAELLRHRHLVRDQERAQVGRAHPAVAARRPERGQDAPVNPLAHGRRIDLEQPADVVGGVQGVHAENLSMMKNYRSAKRTGASTRRKVTTNVV